MVEMKNIFEIIAASLHKITDFTKDTVINLDSYIYIFIFIYGFEVRTLNQQISSEGQLQT
jgi:hypothetical protein